MKACFQVHHHASIRKHTTSSDLGKASSKSHTCVSFRRNEDGPPKGNSKREARQGELERLTLLNSAAPQNITINANTVYESRAFAGARTSWQDVFRGGSPRCHSTDFYAQSTQETAARYRQPAATTSKEKQGHQ